MPPRTTRRLARRERAAFVAKEEKRAPKSCEPPHPVGGGARLRLSPSTLPPSTTRHLKRVSFPRRERRGRFHCWMARVEFLQREKLAHTSLHACAGGARPKQCGRGGGSAAKRRLGAQGKEGAKELCHVLQLLQLCAGALTRGRAHGGALARENKCRKRRDVVVVIGGVRASGRARPHGAGRGNIVARAPCAPSKKIN